VKLRPFLLGRGDLVRIGAVMGSKYLKAITVSGKKKIPIARPEGKGSRSSSCCSSSGSGYLDTRAFERARAGHQVPVPRHRREIRLKELGRGHAVKGRRRQCGLDAITVAKEQHPDLTLLDFILPDINGLTTLEEMKVVSPAMPVILITGYPSYKTWAE